MHQTKALHKQQGMGMLSLLIVVSIIVFFVMLGIKMIPSYMAHASIVSAMDDLAEDRKVRDASPGEITKMLRKRLKINGVYNLDKKAIKYKREEGGLQMLVDYEVTEAVAGNVSVVMKFDHAVTLNRR